MSYDAPSAEHAPARLEQPGVTVRVVELARPGAQVPADVLADL
ncbi:hypothetical protein P8605_12855 [Streptomyces sp. T-3]|nr:hypothetical protein [Streptomyces sp. T-3]